MDDSTFRAFMKDRNFLQSILPISDEFNTILQRVFEVNPYRRVGLEELRELIVRCPRFTTQESAHSTSAPATPPYSPVLEKPLDSPSSVIVHSNGAYETVPHLDLSSAQQQQPYHLHNHQHQHLHHHHPGSPEFLTHPAAAAMFSPSPDSEPTLYTPPPPPPPPQQSKSPVVSSTPTTTTATATATTSTPTMGYSGPFFGNLPSFGGRCGQMFANFNMPTHAWASTF